MERVQFDGWVEIKLENWDEIYELRKESKGWMFRGQDKAFYKLQTSIERACERFEGGYKNPAIAEDVLIREFRRRFQHYSQYVPPEDDDLQWLSLMQHHGAPTRLLDFSYSIFVACYFALEKATCDCAVWAVNAQWAVKQSASKFLDNSMDSNFIKNPIMERDVNMFRQVFMRKPPIRLVCPQNPFRLNERLTIQKGVFLCPGDVSIEFETNLREMNCYKKNVWKILIPIGIRKIAIADLYDMNISRATLFPGLDGFAQSLGVFPPKRYDVTPA